MIRKLLLFALVFTVVGGSLLPRRAITNRAKIDLIKTALKTNDAEALDHIFTQIIPDVEMFRGQLSSEEASLLNNALFKSVNEQTLPIFNFLAQMGVPVKASIFSDKSFCGNFVPEVLDTLFANGQADVNETLLLAVRNENAKLVRFLVQEHGANVNHQDMFGYTLLMTAVQCQSLAMVKLLCVFGADTSVKDDRSFQALDIAIITGKEEIVKYLIGSKAPATCPFHDAYITESLKIVKMLASAGYNLNELLDSYYVLPFYIDQGEYEFAEVLIDSGADVNVSYVKQQGNEERFFKNVLDLAMSKLKNCHDSIHALQRLICKLSMKTKKVDCNDSAFDFDRLFIQD